MSVGLFIWGMTIFFGVYSMFNKVWKEHIKQKEHERTMEKINSDLKIEKVESFEDIKESDLL